MAQDQERDREDEAKACLQPAVTRKRSPAEGLDWRETGAHSDTPQVSANLDLVRSIYVPVGRGDFSATEWAHPEIEHVVADGPEPGSRTGVARMTQHMRAFFADVEDYRLEADEYRELDGERILVLTRQTGSGKKSGVPFVQTGAEVFELRDGSVTKITVYNDRDRAFTDVGLTP